MPTLDIIINERIIEQIPVDSVSQAKLMANIHSKSNDQKTFIYSTINPEKMIENTMVIKRPTYG